MGSILYVLPLLWVGAYIPEGWKNARCERPWLQMPHSLQSSAVAGSRSLHPEQRVPRVVAAVLHGESMRRCSVAGATQRRKVFTHSAPQSTPHLRGLTGAGGSGMTMPRHSAGEEEGPRDETNCIAKWLKQEKQHFRPHWKDSFPILLRSSEHIRNSSELPSYYLLFLA